MQAKSTLCKDLLHGNQNSENELKFLLEKESLAQNFITQVYDLQPEL